MFFGNYGAGTVYEKYGTSWVEVPGKKLKQLDVSVSSEGNVQLIGVDVNGNGWCMSLSISLILSVALSLSLIRFISLILFLSFSDSLFPLTLFLIHSFHSPTLTYPTNNEYTVHK